VEHKLIQGGEQYLPFARSRIKAMRASGMQYASQRFLMPGGEEVDVQIIGNQDYIRLAGGISFILSGAVRDGNIVDLPLVPPATVPKKTLRSYRPTAQAWEYVLHKDPLKSPALFNDEKTLAITAHANTGVTGSQYTNLCSSMYSGLMAQFVQVILGYSFASGIKVKYDYRWARCHGIASAVDNNSKTTFWLIEISIAHGVLAMRLPLVNGTAKFSTSIQDVLRETVTTFGGLPSGDTFPKESDLAAAIASGKVLQLITPANMVNVHGKTPYSSAMGWSFNDTGSEAHNTCFKAEALNLTGYHYKIAIAIDPNIPANSTATLSLVESGQIYGKCRFFFYEPLVDSFAGTVEAAWPATPLGAVVKTPVFVCHINGVLEVVRHCARSLDDSYVAIPPSVLLYNIVTNDGYVPSNPFTWVWFTSSGYSTRDDTYAESDRYPGRAGNISEGRTDYVVTEWARNQFMSNIFSYPFIESTVRSTRDFGTRGCVPEGTRDGYVFRGHTNSLGLLGNYDGWEYWSEFGAAKGVVVETGVTPATIDPTPTLPSPSGSATNIPVDEYDELHIVISNQFPIDETPSYADITEHVDHEDFWDAGGGNFSVRFSELGLPQVAYSADLAETTDVLTDGVLIDSESNPAAHTYAFIGYT